MKYERPVEYYARKALATGLFVVCVHEVGGGRAGNTMVASTLHLAIPHIRNPILFIESEK